MENLNNNGHNIDPEDGRAGQVVREEFANFLETYVKCKTWEFPILNVFSSVSDKLIYQEVQTRSEYFSLHTIEKTISRTSRSYLDGKSCFSAHHAHGFALLTARRFQKEGVFKYRQQYETLKRNDRTTYFVDLVDLKEYDEDLCLGITEQYYRFMSFIHLVWHLLFGIGCLGRSYLCCGMLDQFSKANEHY